MKTEKKILLNSAMFICKLTGMTVVCMQLLVNATALAFGRDPSKEQYIPSNLREHPIQCFEDKELRPFPTAKGTSKRLKALKKTERLQLYCDCNMPDTHTNY